MPEMIVYVRYYSTFLSLFSFLALSSISEVAALCGVAPSVFITSE